MFHPRGPTFLELARQGLSSTRRGYDLLAPKFDLTPFRTPDAILEVVGERLSRLGPFARGLDLCCGTGAGLRMIQPLCTERVVGLDFSEGMLAQARGRLDPAARPAVELVQRDALDLPYAEELDLVTCFGALGHIPRAARRSFLAGIFRALRPGGLLALVTEAMPPLFSPRWLLGRGYNAVAHLRNLLVRPPFVMLYLTFTLDEARRLLGEAAFEVQVERALFAAPYRRGVLLLARRPLLSRR